MVQFKKLLVGLDQSDVDHDLIQTSITFAQIAKSTHIYFVNIIRDFNVPAELEREFPKLLDNALEERKKQMKSNVQKYTFPDGIEINYEVRQGQATKRIMKFASQEDVDLIILGRKPSKLAGVLVNRLARRAGCSLLIKPHNTKIKFDKVLVPIDFSDYSKKAVEVALMMAKNNNPSMEIIAQNVCQVPSGYHYTGKSFEEFGDIMKENARRDCERFLKRIDTNGYNVRPQLTLDRDDDVIGSIYQKASDENVDMVIVGALGRTATTAIFIGSKAERLIQLETDIPVFVIRPKGKHAGILEYLKEL
ncbi:MAG TPA: universal stress protein [Cyclobacteriaceae bacterium]